MQFNSAKTILKKSYFCIVTSGAKRGLFNLVFKYDDDNPRLSDKNHTLSNLSKSEVEEVAEALEANSASDCSVFEALGQ